VRAKHLFAVLAALGTLAGCAKPEPYRPAVDMTGRTEVDYNYDLLYCREAARQQDVASGVAVGVAAGAVLGPVIGAASGAGAGVGIATGVPAGAVAGGAAASAYDQANNAQYRNPIDACMQQRGWTLLGSQATDLSRPPADTKADGSKGTAPATSQ
jgi:hypothetical protein